MNLHRFVAVLRSVLTRGLEFLGRDMQRTRPTFFFGAPRVWEQFQQAVLAQFGGADAFDRALLADPEAVSVAVKAGLGT